MRRRFAATLAILVSTPVLAQGMLGLTPLQNAGMLREHKGEVFSLVCPAIKGSEGKVVGTDVYSEDSAICFAAIHAGALQPGQPGVVHVLVGDGAKSFESSERNGITSKEYGHWPHSFSFVREGKPGRIGWSTVWNGIPLDFRESIALHCPPGGQPKGTIWGTDVYTRDSAICVAAVHVGAVTAESGGHFLVRRAPGPKEFPASERYGIASKRWGPLEDAFAVEAVVDSSYNEPSPPTPRAHIAARTLTIAGFTAAGNAATTAAIAPRSIAIAGFAATGTATNDPTIAPRTLQTSGWAVVGTTP